MQAILEPVLRVLNDPAPDSLPTRNSLLSRIKDLGDDSSWRDFFETYWELIYNFARKAGLTDAEAQDVVQETVIAVSLKIAGFRTGPSMAHSKPGSCNKPDGGLAINSASATSSRALLALALRTTRARRPRMTRPGPLL